MKLRVRNRIRRAREERHLSRRQLAIKARISPSILRRIELDVGYCPSLRTVVRLSEVLEKTRAFWLEPATEE